MAGSLNKVTLIGNLGRDPEVRYTNDNRPIANLTLATSESWKDQSGQEKYTTEVVVDRGGTMVMLGKGGSAGASGGDNYNYNQDAGAGQMSGGATSKPAVSEDTAFDDDIPF